MLNDGMSSDSTDLLLDHFPWVGFHMHEVTSMPVLAMIPIISAAVLLV
jgi:uncharacterized membrane protein YdcZ (DUF606 family)